MANTYLVPFTEVETVKVEYFAKVCANSPKEAYDKLQTLIENNGNPHCFADEVEHTFDDGETRTVQYDIESVKGDIVAHLDSLSDPEYSINEYNVDDVEVFQETISLDDLIKEEGKENLYYFMGDGIVKVKFVDRMNTTKVMIKIQKTPSKWNDKIALSLGYSSDPLAYRNFGGLRRVLEFVNNFSVLMEIDFSKKVF